MDTDRSLVEVLDRLLEGGDLLIPQRSALEALVDVVTGDTIARVLAAMALDGTPVGELVDALAAEHRDALVAALLPGADLVGLDLRLHRPEHPPPGWHGDLFLDAAAWPYCGTCVVVGTTHGARRLAALDRELRAPISVIELPADAAIAGILAATPFDGVRSLIAGDIPAARAAELVLHCPSLEAYTGRVTVDVAEALATTLVRTLVLRGADDDCLARIGDFSRVARLDLARDRRQQFTTDGLAHLARLPALRELHVERCLLDDVELATIARIPALAELFAGDNRFTDGGAARLGDLRNLRALAIHRTAIGDPTLRVVAELRELRYLDVSATAVTLAGLGALARLPRLHRLGLPAWPADDVEAVRRAFPITVHAHPGPIWDDNAAA